MRWIALEIRAHLSVYRNDQLFRIVNRLNDYLCIRVNHERTDGEHVCRNRGEND